MPESLPESALKVEAALARLGTPFHVVTMPDTTRTAQEAARAIGCTVGQIAKSIVFRGARTGKAVLAIASGVNRVDETVMARLAREPIARATPEFVRESTGFAIGGVPPVGFPQPIETWIDNDLLQYSEVWAAAGTPFAVFRLDPRALPSITQGTIPRSLSERGAAKPAVADLATWGGSSSALTGTLVARTPVFPGPPPLRRSTRTGRT